MNFKRLMKNNKGISPIFATLILIAIAVIAGVVVYMFTSGTLATMTGGGTAAQEKVSVQGVQYSAGATNYTVSVFAQSTSGPVPTVNGMLIKNTAGNTVATISGTGLTGSLTLTTGQLLTIVGTGATPNLASGTYTATLTTAAGGSFLTQSFVVS